MKIAVFGSLMSDEVNNKIYLDNATYLGEFNSEPNYNLYKLGANPVISDKGVSSVRMEVYQLRKAELTKIEKLRGFIKNNHIDNVSNRKIIQTPYGRAMLYTHNKDVDDKNLLVNGDWKDYKSYASIQ